MDFRGDLYNSLAALLSRPDLPSWLQAFAAIVALFISAWASWRVGAIERRRDHLQGRAIAVAIYPEIQKLALESESTRLRLHEIKGRVSDLPGQAMGANIQLAQIQLPPLIDRNIEKFYLLGEPAGPACFQLVHALTQYNEVVNDITMRTMILNVGQWGEGISHLENNLTLLDAVIAKCLHEVQPIHDAVKG